MVNNFLTKDDFKRRFLKFWNDYVGYMWDYNSLDVHFNDGSVLKFYIMPYEGPLSDGIPLPSAVISYVSDEYVGETGKFVPLLVKPKKSIANWILETLDDICDSVDIEKLEIDNIYENVIR